MGRFCVVFNPYALSDWIKPVEVNLQYLYYMYEKSSKTPREL